MANSLLTIDMITRKCLEILENNLVISRNVNKEYDDSFAAEGYVKFVYRRVEKAKAKAKVEKKAPTVQNLSKLSVKERAQLLELLLGLGKDG